MSNEERKDEMPEHMMLDGQRRVLMAVDDSEVSSYAFEWGLRNLVRPDDHVIVLSATPYTGLEFDNNEAATAAEYGGKGLRMSDILAASTEYGIPAVPSPDDVMEADASASSKTKSLVNKYLQLLLKSNITSCEGEIVKGDAGSWIADEGIRVSADVIIVGSHASGLVKRTLTGSTSDYVLHNAPCTVAIVRQSPEALAIHDPLASSGDARKIVIAVDESEEAINAFTWALKNFCTTKDNVVIYHVHHPFVPPITGVGTGEFGMEDVYINPESPVAIKDEIASLKDSQKVVTKFMEYAKYKSHVKCEGMVVTGETQAKVVEGLNNLKADAVVVGTHGRGAVARTFLGSVSDNLAHNSPCPLIVVKGEAQQFSTPASPRSTPSSPRFGPSSPRLGPSSPRGGSTSPRFGFASSRPTHEPSPLSRTTHEHEV